GVVPHSVYCGLAQDTSSDCDDEAAARSLRTVSIRPGSSLALIPRDAIQKTIVTPTTIVMRMISRTAFSAVFTSSPSAADALLPYPYPPDQVGETWIRPERIEI